MAPALARTCESRTSSLVLADLGLGGGQLVALELEQGPLAAGGPRRRVDQRLARFAGALRGPRAPRGRPRARVLEPPEGVEQLALAVGVEQRPALVLAVDIDQPLAQPLQACRSSRAGR